MIIKEYSKDGVIWESVKMDGCLYYSHLDTETDMLTVYCAGYHKFMPDAPTKRPADSLGNRFTRAIVDGFAAAAKSWKGDL